MAKAESLYMNGEAKHILRLNIASVGTAFKVYTAHLNTFKETTGEKTERYTATGIYHEERSLVFPGYEKNDTGQVQAKYTPMLIFITKEDIAKDDELTLVDKSYRVTGVNHIKSYMAGDDDGEVYDLALELV